MISYKNFAAYPHLQQSSSFGIQRHFCRGVRDDIEEEDVEEAYYRYMEENPMAGVLQDEQEDLMVEYDNDGNVIYLKKEKVCNRTSETNKEGIWE